MIAKFDDDGYNFFHWTTKISVAFLARLYEVEGFGRYAHDSNRLLKKMLSGSSKGFSHAFLFRPYSTKWQQGNAEISLGSGTKFYFEPEIKNLLHKGPICFERAIIPGASIGLGDGMLSSQIHREMAASIKGVRVAETDRNIITIFDQRFRRRFVNLEDMLRVLRKELVGTRFFPTVVHFEDHDDFLTQALHMAKTRILISTHGMVLAHSMYMEPGGVVIELNGFQFNYPLYERIALNYGHYYMRHEVSLDDSKAQGYNFSHDVYSGTSFRNCSMTECYRHRRDADIRIDLHDFRKIARQAVALVV